MKKCKACGAESEGNFCKKCGASLDGAAVMPTATAQEKPKLGIGAVLSSGALVCLILHVIVTTLLNVLSNVLMRAINDGLSLSVNMYGLISLFSNIIGFLLLIIASGLSIAGVAITFTDKKLCAETKKYCKVFTVIIAALCICSLFFKAIASIVIAVLW